MSHLQGKLESHPKGCRCRDHRRKVSLSRKASRAAQTLREAKRKNASPKVLLSKLEELEATQKELFHLEHR